jgi:hypothetical protein
VYLELERIRIQEIFLMKIKEEKPLINFCFRKRIGIRIWIRGEWKRLKGQCKDPDGSIN